MYMGQTDTAANGRGPPAIILTLVSIGALILDGEETVRLRFNGPLKTLGYPLFNFGLSTVHLCNQYEIDS
jgi:hypothetical protein